MELAELGLVIRSDGVVVARDRLRDFDDQASRTEKRAAAMGAVVGRALGAIGAVLSVRELVNYADAWSDMQSRIGAATRDMAGAPALMQRMVEMANASYSPLNQTVEVYSRNVGVLRDLGYNAGQAADFTEALNHALVVTATRGERAASVQSALAKAMAVGKLQADGLETVLVNGGRVAEALAAELDTNVSGLRAMASQGLITGDVIARALTGRLQELRDEAAEMPATVADAFTRIQTNMTALIGQFDKVYGVTGKISEALMFFADSLNSGAVSVERLLAYATSFAAFMTIQWVAAFVAANGAVAVLTGGLTLLRTALIRTGVGALVIGLGELIHQIERANSAQGLAAQAAQTHAEALTTNANAIEVAKTSSQGFRDGLRSQIELQLAAARAALDEAGAQYQAAKARAANAEIFNKVMNLGANIIGLPGDDRQYGAGIMQKALDEINIKYDQLKSLEGQLSSLGEVESTYKPIEHTVSSLTNVGTAAAAANDNVKTLGATLTEAARAAQQEWEFYRGTFSGFFSDLKSGLREGQTFWEALGNAGASALDKIADRALSMAANGIFDMIFGSLFGGVGNSLGAGWGMAGGFAGFKGIFGIPGMADGGTVARSGLSWVGERGPELLRLPQGAQVIPNGPSMAMAANQNGGDIIINNVINVPAGTSPETAPAIAREVTKELRRQLPDAIAQHNRNPLRRAG